VCSVFSHPLIEGISAARFLTGVSPILPRITAQALFFGPALDSDSEFVLRATSKHHRLRVLPASLFPVRAVSSDRVSSMRFQASILVYSCVWIIAGEARLYP
jgi:hypothetical protein